MATAVTEDVIEETEKSANEAGHAAHTKAAEAVGLKGADAPAHQSDHAGRGQRLHAHPGQRHPAHPRRAGRHHRAGGHRHRPPGDDAQDHPEPDPADGQDELEGRGLAPTAPRSCPAATTSSAASKSAARPASASTTTSPPSTALTSASATPSARAGCSRPCARSPSSWTSCKDAERLCPQAIVLNYTNPMNIMCLAAGRTVHARRRPLPLRPGHQPPAGGARRRPLRGDGLGVRGHQPPGLVHQAGASRQGPVPAADGKSAAGPRRAARPTPTTPRTWSART